jgi:hypothetical protein
MQFRSVQRKNWTDKWGALITFLVEIIVSSRALVRNHLTGIKPGPIRLLYSLQKPVSIKLVFHFVVLLFQSRISDLANKKLQKRRPTLNQITFTMAFFKVNFNIKLG